MTPDPCDREFRSIQVEHAGSAECILRRSMRGFGRAAPCTRAYCRLLAGNARSNSKSRRSVGWPGGSGCGGRRKYVHVGSVAASMRLTPPQPAPPRLRQISVICNGSLTDNENRSGVRSVFLWKTDLTPGPHVVPGSVQPSPGNCQRWGGVGWQDRWRHGWRHRAPMGEGALLAKHCFASARTPSRQRLGRTPEGGLRRVLPVHTAPPTHRQPRAALALALAVAGQRPALPPQVQGAALPTPSSLRTKTISLISANRHPFATPVPYCAAACACGRPVLKIARPSLRSIQDDAAMAGSWGTSNRTYQATRAVLLPLHGDRRKVTSN